MDMLSLGRDLWKTPFWKKTSWKSSLLPPLWRKLWRSWQTQSMLMQWQSVIGLRTSSALYLKS